MATKSFSAGPFVALYVGHYGASVPLTLINIEQTGDYSIKEDTPREEFIFCTGSYEQSGARTINAALSFMSNDDTAIKLARGLALNASTTYGTSTNQQYVILLVDETSGGNHNILIPRCESANTYAFSRGKSISTDVPVQFRYVAPNLNDTLYVEDTLAAIGSILGPANPF